MTDSPTRKPSPWWTCRLQAPPSPSHRAELVASLFDFSPTSAASTWLGCVAGWLHGPWTVGLITGESGTGKSTLAAQAWPQAITPDSLRLASDIPLVDLLPAELTMPDITRICAAVGLSSPPAWLRPLAALSTGQRFRARLACALAHATLSPGATLLIDEFATGVDQPTARAAATSLQAFCRQSNIPLVAVTSRDDLTDWLNPDWLASPALIPGPDAPPIPSTFARRSLRPRPALTLRLGRCHRTAWDLFRHHHYLKSSLARSALCLGAWLVAVNHQPVPPLQIAFSAWINALGKPGYREHRTVVLPPWQGLGVGGALADWSASLLASTGRPVWSTTGHPGLLASRTRSPRWRLVRPLGMVNPEPGRRHATCRLTAGFRYIGPSLHPPLARAILNRPRPHPRTRSIPTSPRPNSSNPSLASSPTAPASSPPSAPPASPPAGGRSGAAAAICPPRTPA